MEDSSGPVGRGKSKMKEIGSNLYKHGRFQARSFMFIKEHGEKARPPSKNIRMVMQRQCQKFVESMN